MDVFISMQLTEVTTDSHTYTIKNVLIMGAKTTTIFCLSKTHQKKHGEVGSIFHPWKLYRKEPLK